MSVSYHPGSLDTFRGEPVLYGTGYTVSRSVIRQHMLIGFLFSLTIVGAVFGVPLILRGYYLSRNAQKALIITKSTFYELQRNEVVWSVGLDSIKNVLWRSSLMGLMEIKIDDVFGNSNIIKGNFYENEFLIIINTLKNRKP